MNSLRAILKKREMTSFLCLVLLFIVVGCINPAFFTVGNISACFNSSVVFVIISVGMAFTIKFKIPTDLLHCIDKFFMKF